MKKGRKWFVSIVLAAAAVLFAACGGSGLDGTYVSQDLAAQTFTFDGDHVTMAAFGIEAPGTYKIEDGKIKIKYSLLGMEYTWEQPFSGSGSTIQIGGTEFKKQ